MARKTITVKYGVQMKEPRRFPSWLKMLLVIGLIAVGIYSLYSFVVWVLTPTPEDILIAEATPIKIHTSTPRVTISATPTVRPKPTINPDMSYELMSVTQNGDHIKAWVNIPGLGLDTVIVQWKDNYYFRDVDATLNTNSYGAVYFDYRSDINYIMDSGNIVIYGYNNLGGRQLKSIVKYVNEEYFGFNTLIVLETIYGKFNFRLFSVHIEEDDAPYVKPIEDSEKKEFIDELLEKTMFVPDNFPQEDSVILTFSTDVESAKGTRLLVHAFLED